MSENMKNKELLYAKTFTSWSGADAYISFNGKLFPEVQNVKWDITPQGPKPISGRMTVAVLNDTPILDVFETNGTITINFKNEFGQSGKIEIHGVEITKYHGGIDVDDVIMEDRYEFIASMIERK